MRDRFKRSAVRTALANDWLVKLAARGRSSGIDAGLDRQVAAALEFERIARLPALDSLEPAAARDYAESGLTPLDLDPAPMTEVIDATVADGVPVRIYVPPEAGPNWLVYYHGGGGVIGSIRASEPVTRLLAAQTHCTVASVDYRLGPEDKHPAAIDDAYAAFAALRERVPAGGRIAVAGDSFGGFLCAHVDRRARELGERPPDLQVLIYPLVDLTLTSPSIERYASGYLLTRAMMVYFRGHYLNDGDDQRAASPWFWDDVADSATAIVVTAGFDPLVDEGNAWAQRLRAAGVTVRHRCEESLVHGFLSMGGAVRAARVAADRICSDIVDLLQ